MCPFYFFNHFDEEVRDDCSGSYCLPGVLALSVSVALPRGAVLWSEFVNLVFPDHTHLFLIECPV